jgi:hypothetical protein
LRVFWTVWRLLSFPGPAEGPPAVWSAAICLGDEAPPDLDRYRYRYVSKKDLLCRKRRENIFFCGILDCLEAPLLPWARVRSTPGVVRGLVPGGRGSSCFGPVPVPVRVKKISFVSKKGAKNIFCVEKMCQDVQPMFRRRISR